IAEDIKFHDKPEIAKTEKMLRLYEVFTNALRSKISDDKIFKEQIAELPNITTLYQESHDDLMSKQVSDILASYVPGTNDEFIQAKVNRLLSTSQTDLGNYLRTVMTVSNQKYRAKFPTGYSYMSSQALQVTILKTTLEILADPTITDSSRVAD